MFDGVTITAQHCLVGKPDVATVALLRAAIRLRWADCQGEMISLRQNKTKARVTIHVSQALRRLLDGMNRAGPYIS